MANPGPFRSSDHGGRPVVLVDSSVLRDEAIVPRAWLSALDCRSYESGALLHSASAEDLAIAEGLIVRSMTRVDAQVLQAMPALRAVATLSSGRDHLDLQALEQRGVALSTGHGGNAIAVADWVLWALCRLWRIAPGPMAMHGRRIVVVGVGAVGTAVMASLQAQGAMCIPVDPPRAARDPDFPATTLAGALADGADALTLHVPLERLGPFSTQGLVDAGVLAALAGGVLVQASRGGVVAEGPTRDARHRGEIAGLALDVFIGEPTPDPELVAAADLVTPHIAGHSAEGKVRVAGFALAPWLGALRPGIPQVDVAAACAVARSGAISQRGDGVEAVFAALDQADFELRRVVADGASFRPLRARHQRCELER